MIALWIDEQRCDIGELPTLPIDFDIEYFGLTFGSLETPTSEAGNWSGGVQ